METKIAIPALVLLFAGCGGGGGDDGGGGGGGPTPPAPPTRPAFAQPEYSGRTSTAQVDEPSAVALAASLADALAAMRILHFEYLPDFATGPVTPRTETSPNGGSVRISGHGGQHLVGWIIHDYTNYQFNPVIKEGRVIAHRYLDGAGLPVNAFSFHGYRVTVDGTTYTFNGTAVHQGSGFDRTSTFEISGQVGLRTWMVDDLVLSTPDVPEPPAPGRAPVGVAVSGRFCDATEGCLTLTTDDTLRANDNWGDPVIGGSVTISGDGAVRLMPLNASFVSILFTGPGGHFNRSKRFRWDDLRSGVTAPGNDAVTADAGSPSGGHGRIELDGRFSHGGTRALEHSWELAVGQAGVHRWLDHPGSAYTVFEPGEPNADSANNYMFKVTVTDGDSTDTAYVVHGLSGFDYVPGQPVNQRTHFGPERTIAVGERTVIDDRTYHVNNRGVPPSLGNWDFDGPRDSNAIIVDTVDEVTFEPDMPGTYRIKASTQCCGTYNFPYSYIHVGYEPFFTQGVGIVFDTLNGLLREAIEMQTVNGRAILYQSGANDELSYLWLALFDGNGSFSPPVNLGSFPIRRLLARDLNGDGRDEIIGAAEGSLYVFDQASDGTFTVRTPLTVPVAQFAACGNREAVAGDFFRTGQVVIAVVCDDGIYLFDVAADGGVTGRGHYPMPERPGYLASADFDGTGRGTLVYSYMRHGVVQGIAVLNGKPDGTFDVPIEHDFPYEINRAPDIVAADLNGDGRDELIGVAYSKFAIIGPDAIGAPVTTFGNAEFQAGLVVADFDGEPGLEIGIGQRIREEIVIYKVDANLQPTLLRTLHVLDLSMGLDRRPLRAWDFDGDGLTDLKVLGGRGLVVRLGLRPVTAE